jgi:hypothetical protein
MLASTRNVLLKMWRKIYPSSNAGMPTLSTEEQTRLSWAKPIESYAAVPKVYQDFFEPFLAAGWEFPYTIQGPAYEGFFHRSTEKLICDFGSDIFILDRNGNTYTARGYPLDKISYVEIRSVLLDSYIKISGVTTEGLRASSSIRFNTVTDFLFTPIVEKIRLFAIGTEGTTQGPESGLFDHLTNINYKFMNFGRRSLLRGEKFIHSILQPEIRTPILKFLGRTLYQTIFPTHMSILTDRELIMIREEARQSGNDRYGGIWDFIPLNKIGALSLDEKGSNLLALSIQLPENERFEYLYQASAIEDLGKFLARFKELTAK